MPVLHSWPCLYTHAGLTLSVAHRIPTCEVAPPGSGHVCGSCVDSKCVHGYIYGYIHSYVHGCVEGHAALVPVEKPADNIHEATLSNGTHTE